MKMFTQNQKVQIRSDYDGIINVTSVLVSRQSVDGAISAERSANKEAGEVSIPIFISKSISTSKFQVLGLKGSKTVFFSIDPPTK